MSREPSATWLWDENAKTLRPPGSKYIKRRQRFLIPADATVAVSTSRDDDANRTIKLQDVKALAIQHIDAELVQKMRLNTAVLFDAFVQSEEMDDLLWAALLYFDALQTQQVTSNNEIICVSGVERNRAKQTLEENAKKVEQAKVDLGKSYMTLIMGLGNAHCHHSLQGSLKHSRTDTDRDLYEAIYETTAYTVWITFGYKQWDDILREIGSALRTKPFNKDIHCKDLKSQQSKAVLDADDHNLASQMEESELIAYKVHFDRPSVGELSRLHSPAFSWLLPSAKECAEWAFHPPYRPVRMHEHTTYPVPSTQSSRPEKLGIIGMSMSECDPATLKRVKKTDDLDSELSKLIDRDEGDSEDSDSGNDNTGGACSENTS